MPAQDAGVVNVSGFRDVRQARAQEPINSANTGSATVVGGRVQACDERGREQHDRQQVRVQRCGRADPPPTRPHVPT